MQRIDLDPAIALPANGIVKADRMARLREADAIGRAAHARAQKVIADAQLQAAQIRRRARRDGHAEGFAAFAQAIAQLDAERGKVRQRVTELVRACLERFLGRLPKEELFGVVLDSVLGGLTKAQTITILVHPANVAALEAAVRAYRARASHAVPIRCEPGGAMSEDACLIYAGPEVIDASVPTMVDEMVNALSSAVQREEGSDDT